MVSYQATIIDSETASTISSVVQAAYSANQKVDITSFNDFSGLTVGNVTEVTTGTYNVEITISGASPSVSASNKVLILAQGSTKTLAYGLGTCIPYTPPAPTFQIELAQGSTTGSTKITQASMDTQGYHEAGLYAIAGIVDGPPAPGGLDGKTLTYISSGRWSVSSVPQEGGGTIGTMYLYDYLPGDDISSDGPGGTAIQAGFYVVGAVYDLDTYEIKRSSTAEIESDDIKPAPSFQIELAPGSVSGSTKIVASSMTLSSGEVGYYTVGGIIDAPISESGIVGKTIQDDGGMLYISNAPLDGGGTKTVYLYEYTPGDNISTEPEDDTPIEDGWVISGIVANAQGQVLRASNAEIQPADIEP